MKRQGWDLYVLRVTPPHLTVKQVAAEYGCGPSNISHIEKYGPSSPEVASRYRAAITRLRRPLVA